MGAADDTTEDMLAELVVEQMKVIKELLAEVEALRASEAPQKPSSNMRLTQNAINAMGRETWPTP